MIALNKTVRERLRFWASVLVLGLMIPVLWGVTLWKNPLAYLFKQWCMLLLGIFLITRRWRLFAGSGAVALTVLWVAPALFVPAPIWDSYLRLLERLPKFSLLYHYNVSLRALIQRLSWDLWPQNSYSWRLQGFSFEEQLAEAVCLLGVFALVISFVRRNRPPDLQVSVCLMAVVLLPIGVCWVHYLVFAVPVIVLVVTDSAAPSWLRFMGWFTAAWYGQIMDSSVPKPVDLHPPEVWALVLSMPLLLTSFLALAWLESYRPQTTSAS